jgi:pSer/pThr/pTyr-binding forkhead associated (FHA) protein
MTASGPLPRSLAVPVLSVRMENGRTFRFSRSFHIGREHDCAVRIEDAHVSRKHVMVSFEDGHWQIRDQNSGNGVFVNGRRVETAAVDKTLTIRLGADGPILVMDVESGPAPARQPVTQKPAGETVILASYAERYFRATADEEPVGGRTMMIRKAYQKVQKKQRRLYLGVVALVSLAALAAGGYAYYSHRQMAKQQAVAEEIFYTMKSLDVDIANLERMMATSGNAQGQAQVKAYLERRSQMQRTYEQFISGLQVYDHVLTPQEQLILRVTRLFGECEMAAPPEYLAEVSTYIRKWQGSSTFANAVMRAQQMGYTKKIVEEFQGQNLPPQFFYLAMQESKFDEVAIGPPTRWGFAKGMWQFIPETARRFGLKTGPLVALPRADPGDDRHQWEKATAAAARYIKEIYSTDAQASGLLVMASYNWGEGRVINMLRTMPQNPRERNFWKVLERHRDQVPLETYDYVMKIVSAAVIGENPRLFGFHFDSPLAMADKYASPQGGSTEPVKKPS